MDGEGAEHALQRLGPGPRCFRLRIHGGGDDVAWSTYDAFRLGGELEKDTPVSTQDRAYTSPIWYSPTERTSH